MLVGAGGPAGTGWLRASQDTLGHDQEQSSARLGKERC